MYGKHLNCSSSFSGEKVRIIHVHIYLNTVLKGFALKDFGFNVHDSKFFSLIIILIKVVIHYHDLFCFCFTVSETEIKQCNKICRSSRT